MIENAHFFVICSFQKTFYYISFSFLLRFTNNTAQQDNIFCRQLQSNENFEVDLSNACESQYLIKNCQPLYISVEGVQSAAAQASFRCADLNCRSPDTIRFGIQAENLGCFSGAQTIISSTIIVVLSVLFTFTPSRLF